jgi:hypothetical protein
MRILRIINMQTCENIKKSPVLLAILGFATGPVLVNSLQAATSAWSVDLTFDAFADQPGGFAADAQAPVTLRDQANPGSGSNSYDVVAATGSNPISGQPTYGLGQDGVADLTIRTTLIDGSEGRWASLVAEKRRGNLRMKGLVDIGTSKSGDYGIVAYEVSFAGNLGVTADQLAIRLASVNGSSQLYEWAFVTAGGMADAPFTTNQISGFNASIYNAGAPSLVGNGDALGTGRSISQYLAGAVASPDPSGGLVTNGWWAIDDFNTGIPDGEEGYGVYGGDGRLDDNQIVTGANLGLTGQPLTSFTVWLGLHDVAFDTNGDGFTLTDAAPQASFVGVSFGTSLVTVPEPSALVFLLAASGFGLRRKRG